MKTEINLYPQFRKNIVFHWMILSENKTISVSELDDRCSIDVMTHWSIAFDPGSTECNRSEFFAAVDRVSERIVKLMQKGS